MLTRSPFLSMLRKKNLQIAERDRRIAELESERMTLSDQITKLIAQRGTCGTVAFGGEVNTKATLAQNNRECLNRHPEEGTLGPMKELNPVTSEAAPAQKPNAGATACHSERDAESSVERRTQIAAPAAPIAPSPPAANKYVRLGRPRPSQIMHRMDRIMEARWQQKLSPAKSAEQKRDEVLEELNKAHAEAANEAKNKTHPSR